MVTKTDIARAHLDVLDEDEALSVVSHLTQQFGWSVTVLTGNDLKDAITQAMVDRYGAWARAYAHYPNQQAEMDGATLPAITDVMDEWGAEALRDRIRNDEYVEGWFPEENRYGVGLFGERVRAAAGVASSRSDLGCMVGFATAEAAHQYGVLALGLTPDALPEHVPDGVAVEPSPGMGGQMVEAFTLNQFNADGDLMDVYESELQVSPAC